jgi:hypothetical protein
MIRILLLPYLALALSACSEHARPPEPHGALVPVNPTLWDYHGDEIMPGQAGIRSSLR